MSRNDRDADPTATRRCGDQWPRHKARARNRRRRRTNRQH